MQVGIPKEIKVHESRVAIALLNTSAVVVRYQSVAQAHVYEFSPIG